MKIFIVFLALVLVFSMFLSYVQDMNVYMQVQRHLKTLSEDCAEAGALTIDRYAAGIDREEAVKAAGEILSSSALFPPGTVDLEQAEVTAGGRGFCVTLRYERAFFRLPYIDITSVSRTSEYVWE